MGLLKIVVFVPVKDADRVREVMGEAGAGRVGNYSDSSFSVRGAGRFKPLEGAKPAIGEVGRLEEVEEERIEVVVERARVRGVVEAIKRVHPYEEVVIDIYPTVSLDEI